MADAQRIRNFVTWWAAGFVVTVIVLAVITAAALPNHGWWGDLRLVQNGVTMKAIVMRTDPRRHCLAHYAYDVREHTYEGEGSACDARVGEPVTVTYLKSNPFVSCLGRASDRLANDLATIFTGGVWVPLFFLLRREWLRSRARRRA